MDIFSFPVSAIAASVFILAMKLGYPFFQVGLAFCPTLQDYIIL